MPESVSAVPVRQPVDGHSSAPPEPVPHHALLAEQSHQPNRGPAASQQTH